MNDASFNRTTFHAQNGTIRGQINALAVLPTPQGRHRNVEVSMPRQYTRLTINERFLRKVVIGNPESCWDWPGSTDGRGYGLLSVIRNGKNQHILAHRLSYEVFIGPIPAGLVIDHLCRNKTCVNPAHLEPVTQRENVMRGTGLPAYNTKKTHCPQGHPYSDDNLRVKKLKRGRLGRACRQCEKDKKRKSSQARKQGAQSE